MAEIGKTTTGENGDEAVSPPKQGLLGRIRGGVSNILAALALSGAPACADDVLSDDMTSGESESGNEQLSTMPDRPFLLNSNNYVIDEETGTSEITGTISMIEKVGFPHLEISKNGDDWESVDYKITPDATNGGTFSFYVDAGDYGLSAVNNMEAGMEEARGPDVEFVVIDPNEDDTGTTGGMEEGNESTDDGEDTTGNDGMDTDGDTGTTGEEDTSTGEVMDPPEISELAIDCSASEVILNETEATFDYTAGVQAGSVIRITVECEGDGGVDSQFIDVELS